MKPSEVIKSSAFYFAFISKWGLLAILLHAVLMEEANVET